MTTRDKILEFMYASRHSLEMDWTESLEELNIYDNVAPIYTAPLVDGDTRTGNTILCFTVLAYDNKSRFLEPHKNRWENKQKIIVTLAGLSALTMEIYQSIIDNGHREAYNLAEWYINYQKDWRWKSIIAGMEYHSMSIKMSNMGAVDAQEAIQIGKMLELSDIRRAAADAMLDTLRTEFLSLDTALEKEDRAKITDLESLNFMSWENYLVTKQKKLEGAKL